MGHLISIRFTPDSFTFGEAGHDYADDVFGVFCDYEATLNKKSPAEYPKIDDILSKSSHCSEHGYKIPLTEVMEAVRQYDRKNSNMKRLPVNGLLFHEGHSGAGLVSNALATFDSTHVISEHGAITHALNACDVIRNRYKSDDCNPVKHQQLVQDVITLLSRTPTNNTFLKHLYIKFTSESTVYIELLRSLYRDAKWIFVYRQAEHALTKMTRNKRPLCAKSRRNPSSALSHKKNEIQVDLDSLSQEEVCALNLSTLLDAAVREHDKSGTGMLLSYDKNLLNEKSAVLETILPFLGLEDEINNNRSEVQHRVSEVLSCRSNGGAAEGHSEDDPKWDISDEKDIEVSPEVEAASKLFMADSMIF